MSATTVLDFPRYRQLVLAARAHFGGGPAAALGRALENELIGLIAGEHSDVDFYYELQLAQVVALAGGILAENGMAGRPPADVFDIAIAGVIAEEARQ